MKTFNCTCNAGLFYENTQCLNCEREVGYCPQCASMSPLLKQGDHLVCDRPECGATLQKCSNYEIHNVCNRCVVIDPNQPAPAANAPPLLCHCCRHNDTIPNLTIAGNPQKWYRLEVAKRRLFYTLNQFNMPTGFEGENDTLPLIFQFLGDSPADFGWRSADGGTTVYTGYHNGEVTLNIREADSVEREKARLQFNEPQRTLIGHFRHEIGHYYWDVLIANQLENEFAAAFGDHRAVTYGQAKDNYYQNGPPTDWPKRFVSAYAAMHPAEDFAETFGTYLDMISMLDTSRHQGLTKIKPESADFDDLLIEYQQLGMALNELNRNLGLLDAVPIILVQPVVEKLRFVDQLVRVRSNKPQPAAATA
jgi:hypothetical protein